MSKPSRYLATVATLAVSVVTLVGTSTAGASPTIQRPANAPAAPHAFTPHGTGVVAHTYVVNTTADADLSGSAPAHRCQDEGNPAKCSLRAAVQTANDDFEAASNSWDVIELPAGNFDLSNLVDDDSLYLDYEGDLTIEGAGPTKSVINASSLDNEILDLASSYVSLAVTGAGFTDGYSSSGGAVYVAEYDSASFTDCAFTGNEATGTGGALFAANYSSVTVSDSTFTDNSATYNGGAISVNNPVGTLTISGDTFSHNDTTYESESYGGGAVYTDNATTIDHSSFKSNTAGGNGGGLLTDGPTTIASSLFSGNHADDEYGGGVYSDYQTFLNTSTFTSNSAYAGGALYVGGQAALSGDHFTSNSATDGGDLDDDGSVTMTGSTSSGAVATSEGGSIYNDGEHLTMDADTITDAKAEGSSAGGGGLAMEGGSTSFINVKITGSKATGSGGYGGGIFEEAGDLSISGGSLTDDTANYGGGGLFVYDDALASLLDTTVSDSESEWGGGVLVYFDASLNATGSTFSGNDSTTYYGGGISAEWDGNVDVTDSSIIDNKADGSEGYGGGVAAYYTADVSYLSLINDTIAGNQAVYAGGIYALESYVSIASSSVVDNTLTHGSPVDYGGGLFNNSSTVISTDTVWADNAGDQCGGNDVTTSGGYNFDSDHSCDLYATGDMINHPANLGPLQNNGGPTETVAPLTGSLLLGSGGPSCPTTDQRGVQVPSGRTCDIGAVFVVATSSTLTLSAASTVKGHEQAEKLSITVTGKVKGSAPSGTASVLVGSKRVCAVTLRKLTSTTSVGSCSPKATQLKTGSHTLTAQYAGTGVNAGSTSAGKKLTVT